jgi:hypothetical protein
MDMWLLSGITKQKINYTKHQEGVGLYHICIKLLSKFLSATNNMYHNIKTFKPALKDYQLTRYSPSPPLARKTQFSAHVSIY